MAQRAKARRGLRPDTFVRLLVLTVVVGILVTLAVLLGERLERRRLGAMKAVERVVLERTGSFPGESEAPIANPRGLAADGDRLYVAAADEGAILTFGMDGRLMGRVVPEDGGRRLYPVAVAVLPRGRLLVADPSVSKLYVVSSEPGRRPVRPWGETGIGQPTALASHGRSVVVADARSKTVHLLETDGRGRSTLGASLSPRLTYVGGVDLADDLVVVSDSNAGRVLVFDLKGRVKRVLPVKFALPRGIAALPNGLVAVADTFGSSLRVLSVNGDLLAEDASLARPQDVASNADGTRLFVTEAGTGRVVVFRLGTVGSD